LGLSHALGCKAISIFTGDNASAPVLDLLNKTGVKYLALRSAGFNHVDLKKVKELGMQAARVPAYSPYAVAEHAVALMLALNRKLIPGNRRIMNRNFSLDGLTGFDMHGKTAGIIGTGKIGAVLAGILHGFGCKVLAFDMIEQKELRERHLVEYTTLQTLCERSDIISLHVPLTESTHYMIGRTQIESMKPGVMLINTARGGLVNTKEVLAALQKKHIGSFGMDVYEKEGGLFFEDHSKDILQDEVLNALMGMDNVLITGHQAFLTDTALKNISETTIYNLDCFEKGIGNENGL
jgi:D-lactate dehydrogenase